MDQYFLSSYLRHLHSIVKLFTLFIVIIIANGCSHKKEIHPALEYTQMIVEKTDSLQQALNILNTIDTKDLSDYEKNLHTLLTVKAHDKLDRLSAQDTVIISAANALSRYSDGKHYVEALYYAGRVMEENGHLTRALQYFKESLDEYNARLTDDSHENLNLKANILANIGGMLNYTKDYRLGIPIVKQSLRIDTILNDSIGMMYDCKVIGTNYIMTKQLDSASYYITHAHNLATNHRPKFTVTTRIYLAYIEFLKGNNDKALNIIRGIPEKASKFERNTALDIASDIYLKAGLNDTAYLYARQLAISDNPLNRNNGLEMIAKTLPQKDNDPASEVLDAYRNASNDQSNQPLIDPEIAKKIISTNLAHDSAHHSYATIMWCIGILAIIILICLVFYFKRVKSNHISDKEIASDPSTVKLSITTGETSTDSEPEPKAEEVNDAETKDADDSKVPDADDTNSDNNPKTDMTQEISLDDIIGELKLKPVAKPYAPHPIIRNTPEYIKARELLSKRDNLPAEGEFWSKLEDAINSAHPDFIKELERINGGHISIGDLRMAMLIKSGFSSSEIGILTRKTTGTMSYHRKEWCVRVFKGKITPSEMDGIIRAI